MSIDLKERGSEGERVRHKSKFGKNDHKKISARKWNSFTLIPIESQHIWIVASSAHTPLISTVLCFTCFTFFRAVCMKKWFVSVDVSNRADFVCKSSRIEWMEWNEMKWMAEWIRSMGRCIYGFSNCGRIRQFEARQCKCAVDEMTRALKSTEPNECTVCVC